MPEDRRVGDVIGVQHPQVGRERVSVVGGHTARTKVLELDVDAAEEASIRESVTAMMKADP